MKAPQSKNAGYTPHPAGISKNSTLKFKPGDICWLKPKAPLDEELQNNAGLSEGCYNHPVVVLRAQAQTTKACIFIVHLHLLCSHKSHN
jgi:hypothetical protein